MGKPTICIGENKDADQLRGNREADQRLFFTTRIVQFLFYLNPKFQASSSFLCLYRLVCVGPVRKPHCWFSHEVVHFYTIDKERIIIISHRVPMLLCCKCHYLSRLVGKPTMWLPTRSDINIPVQSQKRARILKFRI